MGQPVTTTVGRYVVEALAGEGGMGVVYRARDPNTGMRVAVKVLRELDEHRMLRFDREARLLASLHHLHLVRYYEHGVDGDGRGYLVMEWLEGETLEARLERGRLSVDELLRLAKEVASALAAAHERGIVHRDVKPSNIFLPSTGPVAVKLVDFGIARRVDGTQLTATGAMIGTVGYMAPEQALLQENIGPQADVFSLGSVLYECATGHAAFPGEDPLTVLTRLAEGYVQPPRALRPELPAPFEALIQAMLQHDPARRPANGKAVIMALDRVAADMSLAPSLPDPHPAAVEEADVATVRAATRAPVARAATQFVAAPPRPRRLLVTLAGALALVGLGAAGALAVSRYYRPTTRAPVARSASAETSTPDCGPSVRRCSDASVQDLHSVDLLDVLPQVDALAAAYEPRAKKIALTAPRSSNGGVDGTQSPPALIVVYFAPRKPGGGADTYAYFSVQLANGRLSLLDSFAGEELSFPTLPDVRLCASKAAWRAAVAGGMPAGEASLAAVVDPISHQLVYQFARTAPPVTTAYIDAGGCTLARLQTPSVPRPAPAPAPTKEPPLKPLRPVGVTTVVRNSTNERLTDVELDIVGGKHDLPPIEPGAATPPFQMAQIPHVIRYRKGREPSRFFEGWDQLGFNGALVIVVTDTGPQWNIQGGRESAVKGPQDVCDSFRSCCADPAADTACRKAEDSATDCKTALAAAREALKAERRPAPPGCPTR